MKDTSDYSDKDDVLRLLLQGPPKSGKTVLACKFPGAYIIDIDRNLGGVLRYLRDNKLPMPVGYDHVDRDDADALIPLPLRYARLSKLLLAAQENPLVQTIVLDSGTTLSDVLIHETLRGQGKTAVADFKDGRQFWGHFAVLGKGFMAALSQMRKHIVLICHEKTEKTAEGNVVYPIKVAWPGQVGEIIGCFFTNVWRCETKIIPAGASNTYKWVVRTLPDHRFALGNTLGLPAEFEFDWKLVEAKLKGAAK
jgi:hypothetical protein